MGGLRSTVHLSTAEYVRDNAQYYLDLQTGAVIVICLTIVVALLPIAFGVWSAFQKSIVFVVVAVVATVIVVWGGLTFSSVLAQRGDAQIGTKEVEGIVTAVQGRGELASVGLDSQSRVLLVHADPDGLRVGDRVELTCRTIDGAIALSTPCELELRE